MSNHKSISPSTQKLEEIQRRFPIVGDKAIIDLINGIQVNKDIILYRKNRGWLGNIISQLDGSNNNRQILLDGNLIAGQEALYQWVLEITESLKISQTALQITQTSLLEARNVIRNQQTRWKKQDDVINQLSEKFTIICQQVDQLTERVDKVEVEVRAAKDYRRIVSNWTGGRTYTKLPFALQIILLAREVFSSYVLMDELERKSKNEQNFYRELLVNDILTYNSNKQQLPETTFFGLSDLLDQSWAAMTNDDRELTAGLLEIRSIPQHRLSNIPHLFVIGTTLELATLPEQARPNKPAQCAIALCHNQIDTISRTTDAREFITAVVEETANDCLARLP
jgi:hypothetical protein